MMIMHAGTIQFYFCSSSSFSSIVVELDDDLMTTLLANAIYAQLEFQRKIKLQAMKFIRESNSVLNLLANNSPKKAKQHKKNIINK